MDKYKYDMLKTAENTTRIYSVFILALRVLWTIHFAKSEDYTMTPQQFQVTIWDYSHTNSFCVAQENIKPEVLKVQTELACFSYVV